MLLPLRGPFSGDATHNLTKPTKRLSHKILDIFTSSVSLIANLTRFFMKTKTIMIPLILSLFAANAMAITVNSVKSGE